MIRGYNFLKYNDVTLEVVKLVSYKREAIYDKAKINYLYTRHTVVVRGIVQQASSEHKLVDTSGVRVQPNTAILEDTPFTMPLRVSTVPGNQSDLTVTTTSPTGLESNNAFRHALLVPRKKLAYVVGGNYVIDSPHGLKACDVTFGPIPLFCHVEKIAGMGSTTVLFGIQTDINQCPLFEGDDECGMHSYVLSHEYSQQVEIDSQFKTKRTTRGEIRVRADKMADYPCTPDAFREFFAQACPAHYKREQIRVVQHPDMTRLEYVIVDVEQERPIINGFDVKVEYDFQDENGNTIPRKVDLKDAVSRVTKLDVQHKVIANRQFKGFNDYFGPPPLGGLAPNGGGLFDWISGQIREGVANVNWEEMKGRWGMMMRQNDDAFGELNRMRFACPQVGEALTIDITGNPLSTRYELELVAWYILIARMGLFKASPDAPDPNNAGTFRDYFYAGGNISFDITHDVMRNHVVMQYSFMRAAPSAYGLGAAIMSDNSFVFGPMISGEKSMVGDEVIPGITLHSFRTDHTDEPLFQTPAHTLEDNTYNPWGRPGDYMHGTDSMPVRVIHAHNEPCDIAHGPEVDLPLREDNLDAGGCVMTRQPAVLSPEMAPQDSMVQSDGSPSESTLPAAKPQCENLPGWYCVAGVVGYYSSAPPTASSGPYSSEADAYLNCEAP
jgi:hypothetical protein